MASLNGRAAATGDVYGEPINAGLAAPPLGHPGRRRAHPLQPAAHNHPITDRSHRAPGDTALHHAPGVRVQRKLTWPIAQVHLGERLDEGMPPGAVGGRLVFVEKKNSQGGGTPGEDREAHDNVIQCRRCCPAAGMSVPLRTRRGYGMAVGDAPVLEALIEINAASLARTELDARSLMLVRLAALAAVERSGIVIPAARRTLRGGGADCRGRRGCARRGCADRGSPAHRVSGRQDHGGARPGHRIGARRRQVGTGRLSVALGPRADSVGWPSAPWAHLVSGRSASLEAGLP